MNIERITELYDLFNHEIWGKIPENALKALIAWGIIPPEGKLKCDKGHSLRLVKSSTTVDGWVWL